MRLRVVDGTHEIFVPPLSENPLQVDIDVGGSHRIALRLVGFEGPLLLGLVDLSKVVDAGLRSGGFARAQVVRNGYGGQESHDGHHNHNLDERETCLITFHWTDFAWRRAGLWIFAHTLH